MTGRFGEPLRSFASDNNSGAHPAILEALAEANEGMAKSYGDDPLSIHVDELFREHFGPRARIHYVVTGTAANVLGLRSVTQTWQSVLCSDLAHIHVDECGAPEAFGGIKVVPIPSASGKIDVQALRPHLQHKGYVHHSQPRVVQITQCTELGTLYSPEEIKTLADFCHKNDLILHMDGARLANACAALGLGFREMTTDLGVDVLSFGGTKNGMLMGEAVVFLNPGLGRDFRYVRKQGMQLVAKMRFITAQFERYLRDGLWLENAKNANRAARRLAEQVDRIPGVTINRTVQTNAVFASLPRPAVEKLLKRYYFYLWREEPLEVRWMTSFDTTDEQVDAFAASVREAMNV